MSTAPQHLQRALIYENVTIGRNLSMTKNFWFRSPLKAAAKGMNSEA